MATLTRYESFEEMKADSPAISKELFAQKLASKEYNEFEKFIESLRKAISKKKCSCRIFVAK